MKTLTLKINIKINIYGNTTQIKNTLLIKGLVKTEIQSHDFC